MDINNLIINEYPPTAENYQLLRNSLGWHIYSLEDINRALHNSLYSVCIYGSGHIVGMGRIVGDNYLCFYIQDVMVIPRAQRCGVGKMIMEHIMVYLHNNAKKNAYIGLMCKKGKESFYEQFGFVSRPNDAMGPGMVIPNFCPKENT